jgi:predicted outer membrane repeat protein
MWFRMLFDNLLARSSRTRLRKWHLAPSIRRRSRSFRPLLGILEDRWVPTTLTPTTFADGGPGSGSLRDAVLQFNADTGTADDIIQLLPGTYSLTIQNIGGRHETSGLTGDLNLNQTSHRWIIQRAGPTTIIDASQLQDRVFDIVNPGTQVVFADLVIQGGLAQVDGSDGALAGSTDALGGGLLNNGGDVTLANVVLENNLAQGGDTTSLGVNGHNASGGGLYSTGGSLDVFDSFLANNQAIGGRGGDHNGVNRAGDGGSGGGAGLYATGGSLDIANSMIGSNLATGGRGGDGSFATTSGFGNGGFGGFGQGGGLYVNGAALTLASSTIASNQGTGGLSGLYGGGGLAAGYGGGLYNGGTLTVTNSTFSGNAASFGGGGIGNVNSTLTVSNCTLSDNSAPDGGGIYNDDVIGGMLTITSSTLSGNAANLGGGIFNYGTLTVTGSTLSGNSAGTYGGGIFSQGTLTVSNSTLSGNSAYYGGGGLVAYDSPVLHNTLIAGNFRGGTGTTPDDVYGNLDPGGSYNLIGDGSGMTGLQNGVNGNLVGSASMPIDPLLGLLLDNGGPTQTMALEAGSPALNAGDPGQLGVPDQRGVIRAGGVNIGAYQASASALVLSAPDTVQAGVPFDMTVVVVDPFGQPAVGYMGTVTFNTTDPDPGVVLPADYTFTLDDGGTHLFTDTGRGETTLITPGPPRGQQPSPSTSPASSAQAEPPAWSEPAANEVLPAEQGLISFHDGDSAWLTAPRLRHQARAQTDSALAEQIAWAWGVNVP